MTDYVPPSDDSFNLDDIADVEVPDETKDFEFDPDRNDTEIALLNVTSKNIDRQTGPIKFGSFSSVSTFKECGWRTKLKRIDKIKEPTSPAGERGNKIHAEAEDFVEGKSEVLPNAKKIEAFENQFKALRHEYHQGNVELEQDWGFDQHWDPLPIQEEIYKNPLLWYLAKLDVFLKESPTSAKIIDHKSGKWFYNAMKHGQQGRQYAVAAFMRYPELEYIKTEFWYLDEGFIKDKAYTRSDAMVFMPRMSDDITRLTTATEFTPNPSAKNCKFCHYAQSGDCEFAHEPL